MILSPASTGLALTCHLQVYPWTQIIDAHLEMENAKNIGKIICEIIKE